MATGFGEALIPELYAGLLQYQWRPKLSYFVGSGCKANTEFRREPTIDGVGS